jgi:hypothetical protein
VDGELIAAVGGFEPDFGAVRDYGGTPSAASTGGRTW